MKAAIIGGGVIGGGWAARFLLNGWDVDIFDLDPECERKISEVLANARASLPMLYDKSLPREGRLNFVSSLEAAVDGANWVQESVPERLDLKHKVHAEITKHAPDHALIGSSTSGFMPSELTQQGARVFVAHPFNPVYLLPLIELVGAPEEAGNILRDIGMYPLFVRKEIDAHIADRLLEAVWRESLWLVKDGIATTEEIDEAIRMGFGLRWAQMGLFETYRIAGGEAGMKHFMAQFGPALKWPWTKLMDVPEFNDELVELIAGQSDEQSGHLSIRELERLRDRNLIGMMRALKINDAGAGSVLKAHEAKLSDAKDVDGLPVTVSRQIPSSWTDYNGHMNEAHYLELGAQATDAMMAQMGFDADYIAKGKSYFTAENHLCYRAELIAGEKVRVRTQILNVSEKKLHLFHFIEKSETGELAASMESLLIHVDLNTRQSAPLADADLTRLKAVFEKHEAMEMPELAGRAIRSS